MTLFKSLVLAAALAAGVNSAPALADQPREPRGQRSQQPTAPMREQERVMS